VLPKSYGYTRAYLRLRAAERYGQNPFRLEKELSERQIEILESQERLRLAEERREAEDTLRVLAAASGVRL